MAFTQRKDLGVRTAGEKGQKPDEFLTRSQLVPGTNISFDYLPNWDIQINSLSGGGPGSSDCCTRVISGNLIISLSSGPTNNGVFDRTSISHDGGMTRYHLAVDNGDSGYITDGKTTATAKRFFNTLVHAEIAHNWGLTNRNNFICEIVDTRTGQNVYNTYKIIPKVIGVDKNRVRIYVGLLPSVTFSENGWENWSAGGSDDYKIGDISNQSSFCSFVEQDIVCRFTLQEGGKQA